MRRPRMAPRPSRSGYTLVEMLMSVLLTLMMMLVVVQIFSLVGRSIGDSRSALEMTSQVRSVAARLREDLQSLTVEPMPPARPEENKGYLEYIEGPIGPMVLPETVALNIDEKDASGNFLSDTTAGDTDDVLMFTVRSRGEPFVGRVFVKTATPTGDAAEDAAGPFFVQRSAQSPLAEVIWFVRGRTLYRRVLLILPNLDVDLRTPGVVPLAYADFHYDMTTPPDMGFYGDYYRRKYSETDHRSKGFYNNLDLSVRLEKPDPSNPATWRFAPNTLADLTKRENRFAHQPGIASGVTVVTAFPFSPHIWFNGPTTWRASDWRLLGLPTLRESSHFLWRAADSLPNIALDIQSDPPLPSNTYSQPRDLWNDPLPYTNVEPETGTLLFDPLTSAPAPPGRFMGPRVAEDVILTNVISFDVKAWDPDAPLVQFEQGSQRVVLAPGDTGYPPPAQLANILANNAGPMWTFVGRGAYVDLNYLQTPGISSFSGPPAQKSGLQNTAAGVYDTWSTHYEHDGIAQNGGVGDLGTNGFDDVEDQNGVDSDLDGVINATDGVVDDPGEMDTSPPYPVPLRGIQIRLRVFEHDSRQIREVTITQDFLPE